MSLFYYFDVLALAPSLGVKCSWVAWERAAGEHLPAFVDQRDLFLPTVIAGKSRNLLLPAVLAGCVSCSMVEQN